MKLGPLEWGKMLVIHGRHFLPNFAFYQLGIIISMSLGL